MQLRKFIIGMTLPIIPVSSGLVFATVQNLSSNVESKNLLAQMAKNPEQLSAFLKQKDVEALSVKAQNDPIYNNWIANLDQSYFDEQTKAINSINNLEMDFSLQAFLLQNYLEKFNSYESASNDLTNNDNDLVSNASIPPRGPIKIANDDGGGGGGFAQSYMSSPSSIYRNNLTYRDNNGVTHLVKDRNKNNIPIKGVHRVYRRYDTWKDDITEFYYTNQDIYELSHQKLGLILDNTFDKQISDLEKKLEGQDDWNSLNSSIAGSFDWKDSLSYATEKMFVSAFNLMFENAIGLLTEFGFIDRYTEIIFNVTTDYVTGMTRGGLPTSYDEFINKNSEVESDFLLESAALLAGVGIAVGLGLAVSMPVVGAIAAGILLIADFIPSGNGHSLLSNYDDHGLNDWDYQWKANSKRMILNMVNWSYDYRYGIVYKVTDSWFYTPRLEIRTQGKSNARIISGTNAFGNDFNWGHEIQVHRP